MDDFAQRVYELFNKFYVNGNGNNRELIETAVRQLAFNQLPRQGKDTIKKVLNDNPNIVKKISSHEQENTKKIYPEIKKTWININIQIDIKEIIKIFIEIRI
jgi:hypothetical protein